MSDVDTVRRMMSQVAKYGLSGRQFVESYTFDQLASAFNGIGPEWFPSILRKAIDDLHADLQVVAFIHDVRWSYSTGDHSYFEMTNNEFKSNGYKVAKAKYGWYNPIRYWRMNQARIFGNLCQTFGWSAYRAAYDKSKKGKST